MARNFPKPRDENESLLQSFENLRVTIQNDRMNLPKNLAPNDLRRKLNTASSRAGPSPSGTRGPSADPYRWTKSGNSVDINRNVIGQRGGKQPARGRAPPSKSANERLRRPPNAPAVLLGPEEKVSGRKEATIETKVSPPPVYRPDWSSPDCICLRDVKRIICKMCGFFTEGRVRTSCKLHPRDCYLLDFSNCPECKARQELLLEFPFPEGQKTKKKNKLITKV